MNIYLIKHFRHGYDFYKGHVIAAENVIKARNMAAEKAADEGSHSWVYEAVVTFLGKYQGTNTNPHIILSDFNAG